MLPGRRPRPRWRSDPPPRHPRGVPSLHGHYWTFRPFLAATLAPAPPPPSRHWRTYLDDPVAGRVRLTGRLQEAPGADALLVVVHGLGGSHGSTYALDAARAAARAGLSCLRLNLRGADRKGVDFYHAGLTADLRAVLADRDVRAYERVHLLGYSLGGHLVIRYAAEGVDPRVASVATVCAPVDLEAGAREIDQPKGAVYRRHVLRGLKEIYGQVARRRPVAAPLEEVRAIDTIRDWDDRVVAPRFGFADAEDYWAKTSVGPRLDAVEVPALVVTAEQDPMVFAHTVRPHLEGRANLRQVFLERGGHVGFPPGVDLGLGLAHRGGLEDQVLAWLRAPG